MRLRKYYLCLRRRRTFACRKGIKPEKSARTGARACILYLLENGAFRMRARAPRRLPGGNGAELVVLRGDGGG